MSRSALDAHKSLRLPLAALFTALSLVVVGSCGDPPTPGDNQQDAEADSGDEGDDGDGGDGDEGGDEKDDEGEDGGDEDSGDDDDSKDSGDDADSGDDGDDADEGSKNDEGDEDDEGDEGEDESTGGETTGDSSEETDSAEEEDSSEDEGVTDPDPDSPFGINGRLAIEGSNLVNQFGNPIQLRGMGTHGLQWFETCLPRSAFEVLADDFGSDVVRLSMYIQEEGYENDPPYYRALIDKLVDRVYSEGMYVIIDWHVHYPGDPNITIDLAKEFFEHMSKEHGHKGHVIYEIANEPNDKDGEEPFTVNWDTIKRYSDVIIPIIRNNDPESVVIVGTPFWSSQPHVAAQDPLPYPNLAYTMHFYADAHGDEYKNNVRNAVNAGVAVFVTEFGPQSFSGDGPNNFPAGDSWVDMLRELNVSWTNWNFSDDHRTGAVWQHINKDPADADKTMIQDKSSDVCKEADWDLANLKEAGTWIIEKLNNPPDDFPTR